MNWNLYLNFFAAMFAIINPVGIWPVWSELTDDIKRKKVRKDIAVLVILTASVILLVFLLAGKYLLDFFSIDVPVFKIAGGILLLITGLSMVKGSATHLTDRHEDGTSDMDLAKKRFRKILVPLAIPFLAGPGSITTVILYGTKAANFIDFMILSGILLFALFILWIVFTNSEFLEKHVDDIVFTVFTRIFGVIVAAIAVQFIAEGLGDIFPAWLQGASQLHEQ